MRSLACLVLVATASTAWARSVTCEPDGTATICPGSPDPCFRVGPCALGCSATDGCLVPSNVSPSFLDGGGDLTVPALDVAWRVSTDDGSIVRADGGMVRLAGPLDPQNGTRFDVEAQPDGGGLVGVLSVGQFTVAAGAKVEATGALPLVIRASGPIIVQGTIDVGAVFDQAGPGGFSGGSPGKDGQGPGGGLVGPLGTEGCEHLCSAGSSGAGFGAAGGLGGGITLGSGLLDGGPVNFPATPAGQPYGTASLSPLIGGSGGAGGVFPGNYTSGSAGLNPAPGRGGGGGGALQLVSQVSITVATGGVVTAPGGGGGGCISAGGAAGGSGGALLFEAPFISVEVGAVIAANGGGGGAADCT
ncbi:MAG: hypothetical protein AB1938_15280 [Myxococcota bacterium]